MKLNKNEIEELNIICEYLTSTDTSISELGYNLYINNYKDKLKSYITKVRKINSEVAYRCDYKAKNVTYSIIGSYLYISIKDILNHIQYGN